MIKNYIFNTRRLIKKGVLLASLLSVVGLTKAQLSGTVTLGTGGDYTTWQSLASAISGSGVSGPLTVNVISDLTTSSVVTFAQNASKPTTSTNTITINGNGYKLASSYTYSAIDFNGLDYVTIKKLIVQKTGTSTSQRGISFRGQSDYNKIDSCTIEYTSLTSGSTGGGAYIVFSASTTSSTSYTSTYNGSYNTISNCLMRTTNSNSPGPTYAVVVMGSSSKYSSTPSNNTIKNNTIQNFYYRIYYNYYANGDQFLNNDCSRANATSNNAYSLAYWFYSYYTYSTNRSTKIAGNHIHDLPFKGATSGYTSTVYGMYTRYNYGNSNNYFTIQDNTFENILCNSSNYFGYNYYNYYVKYDGNTVKNWRSLGTGYMYGWYMYYQYNDHIFTNNTIRDCYSKYYTYFVYSYYGDRKTFNGNKIINNETSQGNSVYTYVFYVYYPNSGQTHQFEDNVIDSNTFGYYTYGTYLYYWNGTFNRNKVTNNKIENTSTTYGYLYSTMLAYYYNLQCNNNLIANNTGYYGVFGIYGYSYNSGSYRAEFKQNTVQVDATNSGYAYHYTYGLYLYPYYHTKVNVLGNVVDIQNSYGAYPAYTYNTSGATPYTWDYNNYYLKNISYEYWYCPNGNAGNLSAWQNLGFAGNNETGHQPLYRDISNNDFTIDVFELQNKVPAINGLWPSTTTPNQEDNLGQARNARALDHGAIESPMNILAAETGFTIKDTVCAGFKTLGDLTVTNRYVDTIYDFDITLATDDGTKVTKTVTDKILPGDSLKVEFDDMLQLDKVGDLNVMIYVDAANDTLSDDTFYFSTYVKPAPGGSKFVSSTKSTAAVYQYGKPNDVTVIYQPVIYDINAPTKYSNSTYNTDWEAFVQAYTASGRAISGASLSDPATTGGDMEVTFMTGDTTLEDSMVTITVRVLDLNNNCDTFISRDVFIYPSIIPAFSYPSQICEGEAVLFENKSKVLSGSMEFMWDFGTGNAADQTEAPEPVFQFPGSGDYDVTLTTKTVPWGFAFDTTVTITVNPIPTIAFAKTNACEGDELTFTNKTTPSTADMSWDFGDGTSSTSASPKKKYANPGSYVVTLEADLNGCVATMSQKVYQFDRPVADFAVTSGTCDNDVFEFQNNTTMGSGLFGSYWDFDDNGSVSTDVDAMYDFMSSGDKNVSLVVTSEFGCKDTIVKTVSIKESPKVSFTNGPLCSVKPTDFINTTPDVSNTFASYEWNFGDGNTSGAKSPTHNWAGNLGPKKVSLKITLDNGCSEMLEKDLVVLTQPTPNFAAEDVCSGDDVIFVNNTTWAQGEISYVWDFGDGTNSTNSDPVKQYITSVTLTPKVTLYAYIDGGCADSITKEIVINETPRTCDFVAEADYGYGFYGMKVEPVNQSGVVGGQDEVDYVWVFEGGGTKKTSGQDAAAYNDFATDGEYRVTMRATMQQTGCECSITKNVVMNRSNAQELLNDGVSVYPNPASGVFTVATTEVFGKNVTIEVRTMSGQIVKVMENVGTSMVQVDASAMSNGMYLVKVSNGEKEITRKLHIQN